LLIAAVIFLPLFMTYQAKDIAITDKGLSLKQEAESTINTIPPKTKKESREQIADRAEEVAAGETASKIVSSDKSTTLERTIDKLKLSDKETPSSVTKAEEADKTLYNYEELLLEKDLSESTSPEKGDYRGRDYKPEAAPGLEGQVPPPYEDLGSRGGASVAEGHEPLITEDTDSIMDLLDDTTATPYDLKRIRPYL